MIDDAVRPGDARPLDVALRRLTRAADHGVLWMTIAAVGVALGGRPRAAAVRGISALAGASLASNVLLKPLFGRRRPEIERTVIGRRIDRAPWTSSFPSGHSASAAAFATGATLELPRAGLLLIPLAGAVAYSRVHVGVHHRSDVVAGIAVGTAIGFATRLVRPVRRR